MLPSTVLAALARTDPTRPRITFYDDTDTPTRGERIELSGRVLVNWVAKAGNLLQEAWDVAPGDVVRLDLPAHWRTAYWALAVWSVGATVAFDDGPADAVVTTDLDTAIEADQAALVTLAALARRAPSPVPHGVLDEAADVATYADVFEPWDTPDPSAAALRQGPTTMSYAALVQPAASRERVHLVDPDAATFVVQALSTWAAHGSVVLTRGRPDAQLLARRDELEGVSRRPMPSPD